MRFLLQWTQTQHLHRLPNTRATSTSPLSLHRHYEIVSQSQRYNNTAVLDTDWFNGCTVFFPRPSPNTSMSQPNMLVVVKPYTTIPIPPILPCFRLNFRPDFTRTKVLFCSYILLHIPRPSKCLNTTTRHVIRNFGWILHSFRVPTTATFGYSVPLRNFNIGYMI